MRYVNNGIELTCKEHKIINATVIKMKKDDESKAQISGQKNIFLAYLLTGNKDISERISMTSFLLLMGTNYLKAFLKYCDIIPNDHLDIGKPQYLSNDKVLILVNTEIKEDCE